MSGWDDYVGGGLLMAFTGTIVLAEFQNSQYGDNKGQLYLETLLEHPEDYPRIPDGVVKNWYSAGDGWQVAPDGSKITAVAWTAKSTGAAQDAPSKVRNDRPLGQLLKQMKQTDPDGMTLKNGSPLEAGYWKALGHVRFAPVTVPASKQNDDGTYSDTTKDLAVIVELLGGTSNGAAPVTFDIASLGATPEQLTILQTAAIGAKNVGEFQAAIIAPLAGQPVLGAVMKQLGDVYSALLVS